MTLLVIVEIRDMTQVLASRAGNIGGIGIVVGMEPKSFRARSCSNWRYFFFSFRVVWSEVSPFSECGKCRCKEYGLVLNLNFLGRLVLKISSRWDLGLGHGGTSGAITSWATLIYLFEDGRSFKAIDCFPTNGSQLSHSLLRCSIWARVWVFFKKIIWARTFLGSRQHQIW